MSKLKLVKDIATGYNVGIIRGLRGAIFEGFALLRNKSGPDEIEILFRGDGEKA